MNPTTKEGIDRYAEHGSRPGDFLFAVLSNNLSESFGRADLENRRDLFEIVSYCHNEIPLACWGSSDKVRAWMDMKQKEREEMAAAKKHIADLFSQSQLFRSNIFQPVKCQNNRQYKIIQPTHSGKPRMMTDQEILEGNFDIEEVT